MSRKRKYRQDFSRCGDHACSVADKCARHDAYIESLDLFLAHSWMIEAKDCIKNDHSQFIQKKKGA